MITPNEPKSDVDEKCFFIAFVNCSVLDYFFAIATGMPSSVDSSVPGRNMGKA